MKRISVLVLILTLLAALIVPCAAVSTDYAKLTVELTEEEAQTLEIIEQSIQDNYGIEAFFLYDDTMEGGETFTDYAQRYLKYTAQTDDATIFAVSKTSYYVTSMGKAKNYITSDDADDFYQEIKYYDERGEVYNAAAHYLYAVQALLAQRIGLGSAATSGDNGNTAAATDSKDVPYIPTEIAATRAERLYDGADLLTDEEEAALLEKLNKTSEELQFDIVIVTAKSIGSRSPMEFADDYYDYNGFGYDGQDKDGCLLLISMADRDWWVSTRGEGITALDSDYFIGYLDIDHFMSALKDGDYDDCFDRFVTLVDDFVVEARENKPYSPDHRYNDLQNKLTGIVISLIIGLIIGAIVTFAKRKSYTHAVHKEAGAGNYMVNGSMRLTQQSDQFLYTHVDRTRRVEESSSSGGSRSSGGGTHTSSSGATHGGGGGKF